MAKATHDWRLGKALYDKKFPLALQTDLTPAQLLKAGEESFERERGNLYSIARTLFAGSGPRRRRPRRTHPRPVQGQVIRRVLDELGKNHPPAEQLVQAHADKLAMPARLHRAERPSRPPSGRHAPGGARARVQAWRGGRGVSLPRDAGHLRGVARHVLRGPGGPHLAAGEGGVLPAREQHLLGHLTSAHEAYPGHHTQAWWALKDLNPLRATLWNGAFAEGWAVYGEQLLVRVGLGGERERPVPLQARSGMIVAANAMLDVKLQTGELTDEQALKYLVEDCFQEQALAEKKLRGPSSTPPSSSSTTWVSEIEALERDVKARGEARPEGLQRGVHRPRDGAGEGSSRSFFKLDR